MRCVGEIDITRPRWRERPTTLVPVILDNIKLFEPGAAERRFEQGRQEAWTKEQDVAVTLAGPAGRGAEGRRGVVGD
jgi:pyruvate,water dikinase